MKNSSHYTLAFFNREFGRRDVAQSGSAPQWGCGGRWFESSRPDHRSPKTLEAAVGHHRLTMASNYVAIGCSYKLQPRNVKVEKTFKASLRSALAVDFYLSRPP